MCRRATVRVVSIAALAACRWPCRGVSGDRLRATAASAGGTLETRPSSCPAVLATGAVDRVWYSTDGSNFIRQDGFRPYF